MIEIQPEHKPPIEQALMSDLPSERCPLVVVNPQLEDSMTVVVLKDRPETFQAQSERAMPNVRSAITMARKLLELECDTECADDASVLIGRAEGKVAVAVPGELHMSRSLLEKLNSLRLNKGELA